ncbi:hypothetical protein ABW21_db0201903 [Orbilia brochopaga]|nr:hypothetical protein ABW21_db0201903 [Drechslerella brochopaga]
MATPKLVRKPVSLWNTTAYPVPHSLQLKSIDLCHPHYADTDKMNIFFQCMAIDYETETSDDDGFPAYESSESGRVPFRYYKKLYAPRAGVHRGTMLLACFVITGGLNGVLSPTRLTQESDITKLLSELGSRASAYDEVLTEAKYYFYPLNFFDEPRYRIILSFREWKPPSRDELDLNPVFALWKKAWTDDAEDADEKGDYRGRQYFTESKASTRAKNRDITCKLTNSRDPLDAAHVIPETETAFWRCHGYHRSLRELSLPSKSRPTAVQENLITLRTDIRRVFNEPAFCLTVKENTFVAHFLSGKFIDTLRVLHNRPLSRPSTTNLLFLFTRFAWTILAYMEAFDPENDLVERGDDDENPSEGGDDDEEAQASTHQAEPKSKGKGPARKHRGQNSSGKARKGGGSKGQRRSKRLTAAGDHGGAQESLDEPVGEPPLDEELEELRELGKVVEDTLPKGFFDDNLDERPQLSAYQKAIVNMTQFYPGCENTEVLKRKYTDEHPEVRAVAEQEKVWNERAETDEDRDDGPEGPLRKRIA